MILYANGCSHTAAAEAVVHHAFAEDDSNYQHLGRRPHPLNLAESWCTHLGNSLGAEVYCDAESAACNDRIIRTTKAWVERNYKKLDRTFMAIQWTTWEREEWLHNGVYYQVNASGTDSVPPELEQRYKDYVVGIDYNQKTLDAYNKIWDFHCWLKELGVKHVMYNGWSTFSDLPKDKDWDRSYIGPYDRDLSYNSVLINNGFEWVTPFHYHFGANAHRFWASYVLQYIKDNQLLDPNEISSY